MTSVHPTAIVDPAAQLGEGVSVGAYSIVGPYVTIGAGTKIMPHVFLDGRTAIGAGCTIFPFASVGAQTQDLKFRGGETFVRIGDRTTLREYVTVHSGTADGDVTQVGNDCHILAYAHVAHNCVVGDDVIMSNAVGLSGHVIVEDCAVVGGMVGVHQFVRIGRMVMVGGMSRITQDVPPFMIVGGNPPEVHGPNQIGMERRQVPPEAQGKLKQCYKILYRQGLSTRQALERIGAEVERCPEVDHLVHFIETSERGITK